MYASLMAKPSGAPTQPQRSTSHSAAGVSRFGKALTYELAYGMHKVEESGSVGTGCQDQPMTEIMEMIGLGGARRLAVRRAGRGGVPLLLIHGFPCTSLI
jgi:hypothetical protein